jgi:hypothetical protein
LTIWGIWQFWQKDNYWWLLAEGVLLSIAIQSHYLGLLLIPVVGLFWFISLLKLIKSKDKETKKFLSLTLLSIFVFLFLTVVPLIWFDLRHNFINYNAFYQFFSNRQTTVNLKPYKALPFIWPLWQGLVSRLLTVKNQLVGLFLALFLLVLPGFHLLKRNKPLLLLCVWIFFGLTGLALYKQHIYDHYFGFLFPTVFLLAGYSFNEIFNFKKAGKFLGIVFIFLLTYFSLKEIPLKYPPNRQMQKTAEVAQRIISLSVDKPFNLGLIAKQNYDAGYRYFLESWGKAPVSIDAQRTSTTVTEQLYVVCEEKDCQPIGHAQAEIANFGWAKVAQEWEFPWGTKLFKLVKWVKE